MALKLFTSPGNKNGFKALIASEFVSIPIEIPPFQWGVTNKSEEFLKLTPIGKIPVLSTPHGAIFESNAIARYVARLADKGLYGNTLLEMGQIESWIDFATNELDTPLSRWGNPLHGYGSRIPEVEVAAIATSKRGLAALNGHLAGHTYLVGDTVTLADIVAACSLYNAIRGLLSEEFMKEYPHVQRYFFTLANHPHFKKYFGDVKQCAAVPTEVLKPSQVLNPPAAVPAAKAAPAKEKPAAPVAEKKPKEKAAAPEKKPEEPKPAAPAPAADDEEEAEKKPKAKNPLDLLPPSPMVLDAWKRLYSNTKAKDFREVAIKGFWEMFDAEGYSLWFCNYKYNDENQVKFVTLNKVSGFLQRMDLVRKYGFAKMCILGKDLPFVIKGVWLFRGQEIPPFVLEEVYDMELYEWKKVDLEDAEQKELVNQYFEEPDEIQGLELVEAKCFK
eukprot:TRINITY_DN183_c0_g1_i2.p1 TRINITY_DN183_c0_g1~~TRINITY_DN183_c0_g1_i2.p1  ORF type:complete len:445 (-),score=167.06 TRINITY_DN183_c0_g1_i2:397-1731(-)